ncbi:MAG: glutaminyl-peptide cyclotransferase [Aggregatilineales bacterium]
MKQSRFMSSRILMLVVCLFLAGLIVTLAQETTPEPQPDTPDLYDVEILVPQIIASFPHDSSSFTQGLLLHEDGFFYESGGGSAAYGNQSSLRQVDPITGEVIRQVDIRDDIFAEGLALVDDRLIQLTWRNQAAIVYDLATFEPTGIFQYSGEGWGLCYDGTNLYMSDGSGNITVRDSETFQPINFITVTLFDLPTDELNELECVDDYIYANVWNTDTILRIDKFTGVVDGVIDASGLLTPEERADLQSGQVLNGIAYNPETGNFYLTGKEWSQLFEVTLVPRESVGE